MATATILDRNIITRMKNAHEVSFHYLDGTSPYMHFTERVTGSISADVKVTFDILCDHREDHFGKHDKKVHKAFAMIHSCRYSEQWKTILDFLKPGDKLILNWMVGSFNSGDLEKVDFVGDELELIVHRDVKNKKRPFHHFHVQSTMCPVYSSARMIDVKSLKSAGIHDSW